MEGDEPPKNKRKHRGGGKKKKEVTFAEPRASDEVESDALADASEFCTCGNDHGSDSHTTATHAVVPSKSASTSQTASTSHGYYVPADLPFRINNLSFRVNPPISPTSPKPPIPAKSPMREREAMAKAEALEDAAALKEVEQFMFSEQMEELIVAVNSKVESFVPSKEIKKRVVAVNSDPGVEASVTSEDIKEPVIVVNNIPGIEQFMFSEEVEELVASVTPDPGVEQSIISKIIEDHIVTTNSNPGSRAYPELGLHLEIEEDTFPAPTQNTPMTTTEKLNGPYRPILDPDTRLKPSLRPPSGKSRDYFKSRGKMQKKVGDVDFKMKVAVGLRKIERKFEREIEEAGQRRRYANQELHGPQPFPASNEISSGPLRHQTHKDPTNITPAEISSWKDQQWRSASRALYPNTAQGRDDFRDLHMKPLLADPNRYNAALQYIYDAKDAARDRMLDVILPYERTEVQAPQNNPAMPGVEWMETKMEWTDISAADIDAYVERESEKAGEALLPGEKAAFRQVFDGWRECEDPKKSNELREEIYRMKSERREREFEEIMKECEALGISGD